MNVTTDDLVGLYNNYNKFSYNEFIIIINDLLNKREYQKLQNLLSNININSFNIYEKLYIQWAEYIIKYNLYQEDVLIDVIELLDSTPHMPIEFKLSILNSIGIMYKNNKQLEKGLVYFFEAQNIIKKYNLTSDITLKILLNLSNIQFEQKKWLDVFETTKEGLKRSFDKNNILVLPEFIYSKYYSLNKMKGNINKSDLEYLKFGMFIAENQFKKEVQILISNLLNELK